MQEGRLNVANMRAFMGKLSRDTRANTLAIMAAALVPLAGMVGGGIDISRMYIVKTRLQHACDAGALAGRKSMGGGTWNQTVGSVANYPQVTAGQFFDANYNSAAYGASNVSKTFTENAGKVSGTASAVLPMTLMRIFGKTTETLSVTCDAEMRLPNTDVMFVLDTTGSMASKAVSSDTDTKIDSLKTAVKCFYEIVARLDTDANCTTGTPSGGTGDQVQIRFGFVPYSVNVNVGRLLPTTYFPSTWQYQTRAVDSLTYSNGSPSQTSSDTNWNSTGNWVVKGYTFSRSGSNNASENWCKNNAPSTSTTNGNSTSTELSNTTYPGGRTVTYKTETQVTKREYQYNSYSGKTCYFDYRDTTGTTTTNYTRTDTAVVKWKYGKYDVNISLLKNGTDWNTSFQWPIGSNGSNVTVNWNGCIEERETVSGTSFSPIPSGAYDLDVDTVPYDTKTQWKPALGDIEYMRKSGNSYTRDEVTNTTSNYSQPDDYCPTESRKLQAWPDANAFDTYVDSLTPVGNTYHDIGLLWGARLMSPTGIFKSENQYTPQGGDIERHLIFMTDGDTQTSTSNYAAYGLPWYDLRNVASGDVGNSPGATDMNDEVNARFAALCTVVKNKNITLWVISFGTGSNTTTENRLKTCATTDRYFTARNSTELQTTFKKIADQISQLRLTK
ncbi:pilus assembly protein TadG-related protein [Sphingomonas sp. HITSZ_GF]|uniref:TadE/TadG family type IV pilus assembly protein n=1 Tax=Sphingomonas sp. HITSZ_GF TaxID=3037247 RepID=UPI00240D74F7|nr:TadE/TadG family type IV pilus assembly protein [Sphingomonas sp. HITSZ_GF]MDG2532827.1 pilus assembly protein TadG-related protein [Sphingomonas sp. HITSZ_GF]